MKVPVATYRLQFNASFGFRKARDLIPYFSDLGVSDIYASPIFRARKGSEHGYDIVNANELNPVLGSEEDFRELVTDGQRNGIGWVQDIVPNHMAFDGDNSFLMDVIENGEQSDYYSFFDIQWDHPNESLRGRLLSPFLGGLYAESLEKKEIALKYDGEGFRISYYEFSFPLKLESYVSILTHQLPVLKRELGNEHPDFIKFLGMLYSLKNLPSEPEGIEERRNQVQFIKRMIRDLYMTNGLIASFIDGNIEAFNADINLLDGLLSGQLVRLSFWKVATEEINYRRFFNINGLISLNMENPVVFGSMHSLIFKMTEVGAFSGLRVDHIDGLYDPEAYLKHLRRKGHDQYIVVEKILEKDEELQESWPVQGTTGYDFLNHVNGIFCKYENKRKFNKIYYAFTGLRSSYESVLYEKKKLIIEKDMTGDVDNLAHLLRKISGRDRYGSDITLYGLKNAIVEILAHFPVYRTYVAGEFVTEENERFISKAVQAAHERNPGLMYEIDFIRRFLLLHYEDYLNEEEKREWIHFVMRFQQLTGPLMAKGFEDTLMYVYNRLLSLNEVGGSPESFGITLESFHTFQKQRLSRWPHSMSSTATHDSKRGEDVRARLNVLSEMPEEWERHIRSWSKINRKAKRMANVPDRNDEYFLYQTLLGAFPFYEEDSREFIRRIKEYVIKAIREAKIHTAWLKPDTQYEEGFLDFINTILSDDGKNAFLESFLPFQKKIAYYGMFNSLSQVLLKIVSPGVPDFYQGTELWDFSLVDPDNRRPVDFNERSRLLQEIREKEGNATALVRELLVSGETGTIKLFLMYRALKIRKKYHELFQRGSYLPVDVRGEYREHIIACARCHNSEWVLTIVPRFLTGVIAEHEYPVGEKIWGDTEVLLNDEMPLAWSEMIVGSSVAGKKNLPVGELFRHFPVALLTPGGKQ